MKGGDSGQDHFLPRRQNQAREGNNPREAFELGLKPNTR